MNLSDPRTNDWLLIKSPLPAAGILIAWLYFVTSWGPKFMANRKPFQLEKTLIVYNFFQVALSIYIFYEVKFELDTYLSSLLKVLEDIWRRNTQNFKIYTI